jgi:hypothetical protein
MKSPFVVLGVEVVRTGAGASLDGVKYRSDRSLMGREGKADDECC